ncbi:MAG: polymer-forming cytoskeletal protein [Polyangiaceae bacterium]
MRDVSVVGEGTRIRGRITGASDLEILGSVEGEVSVDGACTIGEKGLVAANVNARSIVVRGAVKGDLVAEDSLVLEEGARVVGDLRAPKLSIAEGALVRGLVEAGDMTASRSAKSESRAKATTEKAAPAKAAPAVATKPAAVAMTNGRHEPVRRLEAPKPAAPPAKVEARRGPPPPVVPALKKGAKGALHKKRA